MGQVNLSERLSETRVRLERQRNRAPEPVPKFLRLTRKESRVREDQYAELTALARSLMRERISTRERITENTLIRVAIDLLLAHRGTAPRLGRGRTSPFSDFQTSRLPESTSRRHGKFGSLGVPGSRSSKLPK